MARQNSKKNRIKTLENNVSYLNDRVNSLEKDNAKLLEVLKVAGILEESEDNTFTFTDSFGFYKQVFKVNEVF